MTYSEFISTFSYGISIFFNSLVTISNSLLSNYIFITFFGIILFTLLCSLIYNLITSFLCSNNTDLDNVGGKK